MIKGIGTDIVSIARIAKAAANHEDRFLYRILTPNELLEIEKRKDKVSYIAKRYAAKEAIAKAMGTGIGADLSFQDIEISNLESGAPTAHIAKQPDLKIHLSMSDEKDYAIAFTTIETKAL
jgi:holo-[acyl-carrier protein] synthase